jgi:hypothetical protein
MLVSRGALSVAHGSAQIHVARSTARLADTLPRSNQIVLLVREFGLLLVVHHWRVVEFALLVLEGGRSACCQMLRHLAQLRLVRRQSLLLVHESLYKKV